MSAASFAATTRAVLLRPSGAMRVAVDSPCTRCSFVTTSPVGVTTSAVPAVPVSGAPDWMRRTAGATALTASRRPVGVGAGGGGAGGRSVSAAHAPTTPPPVVRSTARSTAPATRQARRRAGRPAGTDAGGPGEASAGAGVSADAAGSADAGDSGNAEVSADAAGSGEVVGLRRGGRIRQRHLVGLPVRPWPPHLGRLPRLGESGAPGRRRRVVLRRLVACRRRRDRARFRRRRLGWERVHLLGWGRRRLVVDLRAGSPLPLHRRHTDHCSGCTDTTRPPGYPSTRNAEAYPFSPPLHTSVRHPGTGPPSG